MAAAEPAHGFSTRAIHAGQDPDPATGATVVPIYATSTFTQEAPGRHKGYEYVAQRQPDATALETCLAALEGSERALAFASGLAATTAVLSTLRPGDEVAAAADLYGGTFRLLERVFKPWGLVPRYTEDASPDGFARILSPHTKLIWIETPTNPLLQIIDIAAIAALAHDRGALLAVDNTFASPYLQRPIELGADLVVHSTTKYLAGHSDVIGGAVAGRRELARADRLLPECRRGRAWPVRFVAGACGASKPWRSAWSDTAPTPACLPRGWPSINRWRTCTIPVCPAIPTTRWPGRQMRDFGGMISVRLKGGAAAAQRLLTRTRLFSLAESLGGVESLIGHPATMTHASIPADVRAARGVDDGLVRLSVGIEDVDDLRADLEQALA